MPFELNSRKGTKRRPAVASSFSTRKLILEVTQNLVFVVVGVVAAQVGHGGFTAAQGGDGLRWGVAIAQAAAFTLLNPHVYLDTVILVGAVGAKQPDGTQGAFLLGAACASTAWFVALGYGARVLTPLFAKPLAWRLLDLLVSGMMWTIAAGLVQRSLHL